LSASSSRYFILGVSRIFGVAAQKRPHRLGVVLIDDARRARRDAKTALAGNERHLLGFAGVVAPRERVGDVMIEPQRRVRMVGEIGDHIAAADLDLAVLHEFGLDEEVGIDLFH
jgi:hypothetical protein